MLKEVIRNLYILDTFDYQGMSIEQKLMVSEEILKVVNNHLRINLKRVELKSNAMNDVLETTSQLARTQLCIDITEDILNVIEQEVVNAKPVHRMSVKS